MSTALNVASGLANSYGTEQFIPVGVLQTDHTYQRPLQVARAAKIAKAFDFELAGRLIVSQREDGGYWVVDGQHRLAAMKVRKIALAPCVVYTGWTADHEAKVFYETNTTVKKPSVFERHRAGILIGDPVAVGIEQIVHEIGGEITEKHPESGAPNRIAAVEMMGRIYRVKGGKRAGPEYLRATLHLIMDVWGQLEYQRNKRQIAPFNADVIYAVAVFLMHAEDDPNFSEEELRNVLSRHTPHSIAQAATVYIGQKPGIAIALKIKDLYNARKRGKKLDESRPIVGMLH